MRPIQISVFGSSYKGGGGPPPPVGPVITRSAEGGSMYFVGIGDYVAFPGSNDWAVGTGDYTIEWWQWLTTSAQFPRPFSVGTYPSASIAVSLENGTFYFWSNGNIAGAAGISNFQEQWVHFAVCRASNTTRIFQNGVELTNFVDNNNISNSSTELTIGNESVRTQAAMFAGWITNFRWTKGEALYTSNFSVPPQPLTVGANTKLLLLAESSGAVVIDSAGLNVSSSNLVTWQPMGPYSQRAWLDAGNSLSYTDPSANWLDLTPYDNDVTLTNTTYNASVGGHLLFGATGGAVFNNNPAIVNANKVPSAAITMWINVSDNVSGYNFIAGTRGAADFNFYFLLVEGSNLTEARVHTTSGFFDINTNFSSYYNTWCHICFVVNGNRSDLYINGTLAGSNTNITGTWGNAPAEFTIARETGGGNQTPNLKMATLRYHTRARTAAEVMAEYNAEAARFAV